MAKRTLQANYFADDKDIYDLLVAARQKLTPQKLVEFARRRGLILPPASDREELIEQVAVLPFGWHELTALIAATDTADRVEKMASRSLAGGFSLDDVKDAVESIRDDRQDRGERYKIEKQDKTLKITVAYSELDTSKTRLVQRTQREFTLEFEIPTTGKALVRHQDQPRAAEVLEGLVALLESKPDQNVEQRRIELAGVRDPTRRTKFFLHLIKGLQGFQFEDVKAVKASRFQEKAVDSVPDAEDAGDDLTAADEGVGEEIEADEATFIARVKEIAIKGDGLLKTPQYEQLAEHGFFVRSIVWTATDEGANGPRVEFESGFDDPEQGTGFTYTVRALHSRKADGEFKKSKVVPEHSERTRLLRLLEEAAQTAMDEIVDADPESATVDDVEEAS